jgi:hypothetical protein
MGAFAFYSKRELQGMSAQKRAALKKHIEQQLKKHAGIRRMVRQKTRPMYRKLKAKD